VSAESPIGIAARVRERLRSNDVRKLFKGRLADDLLDLIAPDGELDRDALQARFAAGTVDAATRDLVGRVAAWTTAWHDLGASEDIRIHGALELASATPRTRLPALFAVPLGEDYRDDLLETGGTQTVQQVLTSVAVVSAVPARNDPGGRTASEGDGTLDALSAVCRARLIGWRPLRGWNPLAVRRSRLVDLADGRAFWQDEFTTSGWARRPRT